MVFPLAEVIPVITDAWINLSAMIKVPLISLKAEITPELAAYPELKNRIFLVSKSSRTLSDARSYDPHCAPVKRGDPEEEQGDRLSAAYFLKALITSKS